MAKEKESVEIELITPAIAKKYLEKNTRNRPMNDRNLARAIHDLKKGKWKLTTDCVGFDWNGFLINSQHRLKAIEISGVPAKLVVLRGLEPDAFNVIDIGKRRGGGDILGSLQIANPNNKSAIIAFVLAYKKGRYNMRLSKVDAGIANQDIVDFYEANAKRIEAAWDGIKNFRYDFKGLATKVAGGLYFLFSGLNKEDAATFFEKLAKGTNISEKSPIYLLRKKLEANANSRRKHPLTDQLAWIILAWNAYRTNKQTDLSWKHDEDEFPKPI